jgi:hypothetical protein
MTLVFGAVGAGIGASFGNPQLGFAIGVQIGGLLFPPKLPTIERGKIDDARISGSAYGTMIPICYGNTRVGGNIVWADDLVEHVKREQVGGASGGGGQTVKTYTYSRSFLVYVCEAGLISGVSRIWADDKVIYENGISDYEIEFLDGNEAQVVSSFIEAIEGAGNVPGYRGVYTVLFKDMDLTAFGGRIPNLSFETGEGVTALLEDTFTDANNTGLTDHTTTPEPGSGAPSGEAWEELNVSGASAIVNNRLRWNTAVQGGGLYAIDYAITPSAVDARCDFFAVGNTRTSNSVLSAGVAVGIPTIGINPGGVAAFVYMSAASPSDPDFAGFRLYDISGGSANPQLDEYAIDLPLSSDDPYQLRLVVDAGVAYGYYRADSADEWTLVCQSACDALPGSYYCGIWQTGGINGIGVIADGVEIDNLVVYAYENFSNTFPLSDILDDVMDRCGLDGTEYDNSDADAACLGYMVPSRMSGADAIASPLLVHGVDLVEVDGEVRSVETGGASQVTIPSDDLGAVTGDNRSEERIRVGRTPDLEIPARVDLNYVIRGKAFQQGVQSAVRHTKGHVDEVRTIGTALTMTDDMARPKAEELLYRLWLQRESPTFRLGPKYYRYAPGDVVTVPIAGENVRCKIVRCDIGLISEMAVSAVTDDDDVADQPAVGGDSGTDGGELIRPGNSTLVVWNGNALVDEHGESVGLYMAACGGDGWLGCDVYISRDSGSTYEFVESLVMPAIIGETIDVLPTFGTTGLVDEDSIIEVTIPAGTTLESVSLMEMLNGANAARIGDEVVQFMTATLLGDGHYQLSGFLRGRRGTVIESHVSGTTFTMLSPDAVHYEPLGDEMINKTLYVKGVSSGQTLGDVVAQTVLIEGLEYKCYSPVDVEGSRDGGNNLTITWKRRTRMGGQLRDYEDVPLSEDVEAYEVDIWDGASVVRTITGLSSETASYSAANQTTDGFTPGDPITVRVYQLGKYSLRGYVTEATI